MKNVRIRLNECDHKMLKIHAVGGCISLHDYIVLLLAKEANRIRAIRRKFETVRFEAPSARDLAKQRREAALEGGKK